MNYDRRFLLRHAAAIGAFAIVDGIGIPGHAESITSEAKDADRQLPIGDEIFLDHVGHFVRDPEAASRAMTRAGFAPAPLSIQVNPDPAGGAARLTGTGNVTAMFRRGYLEMLFKTADTPLGRELDGALGRYAGVHLAGFSVADAAKAHERLGASGFRTRPLVQMQRPVETETGSGVAAFTVARVEAEAMPEGRMQILTHRTEGTVWQPRWLNHPNGAIGLLDLVIAVADEKEASQRFARFTDRKAAPDQSGQIVRLDRGGVQLMTAAALTAMLPEVVIPSLPYIAGYGVAVTSLDAADSKLRQGGLQTRRAGKVLVARFPEELGTGAWFFVETAADLPWRG